MGKETCIKINQCTIEDFGKTRFVDLIDVIEEGAIIISTSVMGGGAAFAEISYRLQLLNTIINTLPFDVDAMRVAVTDLMRAINIFLLIPGIVVRQIQTLNAKLTTLNGYVKFYTGLTCVLHRKEGVNMCQAATVSAISRGETLLTLIRELFEGLSGVLGILAGFGSITTQQDAQDQFTLVFMALEEATISAELIGPLLDEYMLAITGVIDCIREQGYLYNVCCGTKC